MERGGVISLPRGMSGPKTSPASALKPPCNQRYILKQSRYRLIPLISSATPTMQSWQQQLKLPNNHWR